jgi:hypothetical protein
LDETGYDEVPAQYGIDTPSGSPSKKSKLLLLPTSLGIAALVIVIIALITPWWVLTIETPWEDYDVEYKLQEYTVVKDFGNRTEETTTSYSSSEARSFMEDMIPVFNTVFMLTITTLVLLGLGVVINLFTYTTGKSYKMSGFIYMLALIITFLAAFYFMNELPESYPEFYEEDRIEGFSGDTQFILADMSWGPGIGWTLIIVSGIIMIIAMILSFIS